MKLGHLPKKELKVFNYEGTRWAPTSYKWSYNPYKWCYKWVTEVITPISGVITQLITGFGAHLVGEQHSKPFMTFHYIDWLYRDPYNGSL